MKKIILFKVLLAITIFCPAQELLTESTFSQKMENVNKIVERKFSKWTEKSFYNDQGFLSRQTNFYKGKKRSDYQYEYFSSDTVFIIKELMNNDTAKCLYFHFSYDSLANYTLVEYYSASNLDVPFVIETNFVYKGRLLISFDRDGSVIQFQYDSLARISQEISISGYSSDTTYTNYLYDKFGRKTDCIVESSNPEADFVSVFVYSSEKRNKVHFRYSDFDKYGNWRKSYFVTEKGNLFCSKRKIKYNM